MSTWSQVVKELFFYLIDKVFCWSTRFFLQKMFGTIVRGYRLQGNIQVCPFVSGNESTICSIVEQALMCWDKLPKTISSMEK